VRELEDKLQEKAARVAELEAEVFRRKMDMEEALRELGRKHADELDELRARRDEDAERVRQEYERRNEEERRIADKLREELEQKLVRVQDSAASYSATLQDKVAALQRELAALQEKNRALEDALRGAALVREQALRDQARDHARSDEEAKREIFSLRTICAKAEESVVEERRAKEKAIDEKIVRLLPHFPLSLSLLAQVG